MINWIVSSSVLIFVIIVLRFLLKGKISLRLQYALWALVLVRLLIPVSIGETAISIGNWLDQTKEVNEIYELSQAELPSMTYQQAYEEVADKYENQGIDISAIPENEFAENIDNEITDTMTGEWSLAEIVRIVWILGGVAVGAWFFISNFRFYKKLMDSRQLLQLEKESLASHTSDVMSVCKDKLLIYVSDEVDTPCLFGIFHPAIYVTSEVLKDEVMLRHVIAHETTHHLHRDYIWGYLRALCLIIHWYNPFVWCAAFLSRNDAELACDEASIQRLGESERAAYGRTLIGLTCQKRSTVLLTATTMTGSGKSIKERIALIVRKTNMKIYTLAAVVFIAIICVGCTFTGAKTDKNDEISDGTEADNLTDNTEENGGGLTGVDSLTIHKILFYDALLQDMLITDEEVNHRVLQLLMNEKQLIDTIESECEMDLEQSVEVDGCPYYRVLEADSWEYYENIARNYYSEEYSKENFSKKYIEEYELFVEVDEKLYRAAADGIVSTYLEDSIQVWKVDEDTYYATITALYAAGSFDTMGYQLRLSENNIYGFEIVDKPYVKTNANEFTHYADLTHDGIDECIRVSIIGGSGQEDAKVKIRVYEESAPTVIYETELCIQPNQSESYHFGNYNGKDYLMHYKSGITPDTAMCEYEVFYLSETGEKKILDDDEIEISLIDVEAIDINAWEKLAEDKNSYFEGSFVLAQIIGDRVEYSTDIERLTYTENMLWLIIEDTEQIKIGLDLFLEEVREMYSE